MLDPTMLLALAGGAKGGGSTKVSQSASNSSVSGLSLSISNVFGGGSTGQQSSSLPQSSSPIASATQTPDASPSPSYGAFPDTAYNTALPDTTSTGTGSSILSSPIAWVGIGGLALVAILFGVRKK